jgi:hypothetical protein
VNPAAVIREIKSCREASVRRTFESIICTTCAKISRSDSPIIFFKVGCFLHTPLLMVRDRYLMIVRADRRRQVGVGVDGGQSRSINAREGHSLDNDHPCGFRASHGGEARREASRRRVAAGGAARSCGGDPEYRLPPGKPRYGGFSVQYFCTRLILRTVPRSLR